MLKKKQGQVHTPPFIVKTILELADYTGVDILQKHIIDNSCGDGAFLKEIVKLYCETALTNNIPLNNIQKGLATFIHGIEIDPEEYRKCIKNLDAIASSFNISHINWDIQCADATNVSTYDDKMDFVVGNPPYIRIHNLADATKIKKRFFTQHGMTDLYIAFFETGLKMLKKDGILGYITPSSYFNSLAANKMRIYFAENNLLKKIVDLKHFQPFNATTYTAISILQKENAAKNIEYYLFNDQTLKPVYIDTLNIDDCYISGKFYFSRKNDLNTLKKIYSNISSSDICVKNGYATLCDSVFIQDFPFQSEYIIPTIKSSKGITQKIFYPYDKNANLVAETELKKDKNVYSYLQKHKKDLLTRANEKDPEKYWYAYGRSQAINDTYKNKLAINTLLRTENDFKFMYAPKGTGVYSGLYIISNKFDIDTIKKTLKTKEFMTYVSLLGKYKSGGYYTFSSKDVKAYLDYKLSYTGELFYADK